MLVNGTQRVGEYRQHFNPFVYWLTMDFTMDPQDTVDVRLKIATGILLAAIEGRQR